MNFNEIKLFLNKLDSAKIKFSNHFFTRLNEREGNVDEVIFNLTNPNNLVHMELNEGKYVLYFKISNSRTMILPIVIEGQYLYVITYILRYRAWKK